MPNPPNCPQCGTALQPTWRACPTCALPLAPVSAGPAPLFTYERPGLRFVVWPKAVEINEGRKETSVPLGTITRVERPRWLNQLKITTNDGRTHTVAMGGKQLDAAQAAIQQAMRG